MTEPEQTSEPSVEAQAEAAARALGRQVLGREMTADEAAAITLIFKASVQALKQGFIRRLAKHVQAEREDETVERFFENIQPD